MSTPTVKESRRSKLANVAEELVAQASDSTFDVTTFFEKFELLAQIPESILILRKLIVSFAVTGKLVPQDHADKPIHLGANDHLASAFELPVNWGWAKLSDIGQCQTGRTPATKVPENYGSGFPFVGPGQITQRGRITDSEKTVTAIGLGNAGIALPGDVLMVCIGGSIGKTAICRSKVGFNQQINSIRLPQCLPEYIYLAITSNYFQNEVFSQSSGSATPIINKGKWEQIPIPLPPLAEQKRIVAKVDELMGLCDRLEALEAERSQRHASLSRAALARFADSPTPTNLQFLFHNSFDIEPDQLRQSVLSLAIRGLLVSQYTIEQSAGELFEQIRQRRESLAAAGVFKGKLDAREIEEKETLFEIPTSWKWVRAAEICYPISSGTTPAKSVFRTEPENAVPYLKVYNIREQKVDFDYRPQYIDFEFHRTKMKRCILVPGTVLLNIVGPPLGKTAIVPDTFPEWSCNQAISFFRLIEGVMPEYFHLYLKAGEFLRNIALIGTAGQDNISVTKCKNIVIPLPPLAEQKRIVAKVDELMALVDKLEQQLAHSRTLGQQLLEAVVAQLTDLPNNAEVMK